MSHALRHTIATSWLGLLAGRGVGLAASAVSLGVVARSLSDARLAVFLLHLVTFAVASLGTTTGIMPVLLRDLATTRSSVRLHAAMSRCFVRAILAAAGFVAVLTAFGDAEPGLVVCAGFVLLLPFHLAAAPSLLSGRTGPLARAEVQGRLAATAAIVLAWATGATSAALFLGLHLSGQAIANGLLFVRLDPAWRRIGSHRGAKLSAVTPSELWVALGDLTRAGYFYGVQWIVAALGSFVAFGAPMRLLILASALPAALATTIQGPLSRGKTDRRRAEVLANVGTMLALGGAIGALLMAAAPFWVRTFFPHLATPQAAAGVLRTIAVGLPALFAAGLCLPFLIARGRERAVFVISVGGLLALLGIVCALWPDHGLQAAAWGLTACEWLVFVLSWHAVRRA